MKRYDLMHQVNARGTFLTSKACIPHLKRAANPHVLALSPPLDLNPRWFGPHVAYTMAKFSMSMAMLGMAEEFRADGVAFNALWPRTTIATSAIRYALGGDAMMAKSRSPEIVADAAYEIFNRPARECTGNFFIDDTLLFEAGERDFDRYRMDPKEPLLPDFFVPESSKPPPGVSLAAIS
jgi:citronellol/citronellal dehydrogenase